MYTYFHLCPHCKYVYLKKCHYLFFMQNVYDIISEVYHTRYSSATVFYTYVIVCRLSTVRFTSPQ